MDLFTVDRYDVNYQKNDPDREERILKRLNKTIERKKKKFKKSINIDKPNDQDQLQSDNDDNKMLIDETTEPDQSQSVKSKDVSMDSDIVKDQLVTHSPIINKDFMILGDDVFQKKKRINMILPNWLAHPTIISNDLTQKGKSMKKCKLLSKQLIENLQTMEIKRYFPVQEKLIPWMLHVHSKPVPFRPRDICVSAPTGSGKTLAYAIPIVQLLLNEHFERKIRALIVLPVNELAVQVIKVFKKLCQNTGLTCILLSKFGSFKKEQQQLIDVFNNEYHSKVDICVTTTGRLIEHLNSTIGFSLKSLKFLVIDEADRIIEQINNNWLYHLNKHLKEETDNLLLGGGGGGVGVRTGSVSYLELSTILMKQPHKMLFSATLSQDPEKLQNLNLFHPQLFTAIVNLFEIQNAALTNGKTINDVNDEVEERRGEFIGKYTTPAELTEKYCITELRLKPLTLYGLVKENKWKRFLCFTNKGDSAHRLSYVLQSLFGEELKIEELSSGLSPYIRNQVLLNFKTNKINGLICSDALARGIDIPDVDIVISYDFPRHIKTYVHRIGRTARAGKLGTAITMLAAHELKAFTNIIKEAGKFCVDEIKITTNIEELKAKEYATALKNLQNALQRENHIKAMKISNEKNRLRNNTKNIGGFITQLQSELQKSDFVNVQNDANIPESWKWENQSNIKNRKEKKSNKKKKKKIKMNKIVE